MVRLRSFRFLHCTQLSYLFIYEDCLLDSPSHWYPCLGPVGQSKRFQVIDGGTED